MFSKCHENAHFGSYAKSVWRIEIFLVPVRYETEIFEVHKVLLCDGKVPLLYLTQNYLFDAYFIDFCKQVTIYNYVVHGYTRLYKHK